MSYNLSTVQSVLQQPSPHWMGFLHIVSVPRCRKANLEWDVILATEQDCNLQLKQVDFMLSFRFVREVSSLIYPFSGLLPLGQSQFCKEHPLSPLIIPRGDGMNKPYGANSIYELKHLTINQGTWSMPYLFIYFFYHPLNIISHCTCPSGGSKSDSETF